MYSIWFKKERADRIDDDNSIYIVTKAQIIKVVIITQLEYSFEIVFRCKSFLDLTLSYVVTCQNITIFLVIDVLIKLDLQAHFCCFKDERIPYTARKVTFSVILIRSN